MHRDEFKARGITTCVWTAFGLRYAKFQFAKSFFALFILLTAISAAEPGLHPVAANAAESNELYFDPEISPPADMPGCVEVQAKIRAVRSADSEIPRDAIARAKMIRDNELKSKLPTATVAAETVVKAIQERLAIPLENLAKHGRGSGPECLKSLDLSQQTLTVVTIAMANQYTCNDGGVCSLPTTVTYAICHKLSCRAEKMGELGPGINPDVFNPAKTLLQSLADRTIQNAFSRLK